MKPLYRFYMNLGIASLFASIIFCLYHFAGPASMITLIFLIPFMMYIFAEANSNL